MSQIALPEKIKKSAHLTFRVHGDLFELVKEVRKLSREQGIDLQRAMEQMMTIWAADMRQALIERKSAA